MAGISKTQSGGKTYWSIVLRYKGVRVKEPLSNCGSREEAERIRKKIERQMLDGSFNYLNWFSNSSHLDKLGLRPATGAKLTLREYATRWLQKKRHIISYRLYEGTLRKHILSAEIANRPLGEITKSEIELFIADLRDAFGYTPENGVGGRAINITIARLRTIFSDAFYDDLIDKDPMLKVENVREGRPEIDPFTIAEVAQILAAASGGDRALLTVLFFTGMRPNEALTLKWTDVDWGRGLISVKRMGGRMGVHLPKTRGSERDVVMLDAVIEALREQRSRTELKSRNGWIFPSGADTPITIDNFRNLHWRPIIRKSGVKYRTLYQCRHTYATIMLGSQPVKWVADQLGHTTIGMVVNHYAKWTRTPENRAMGAVNADISQALSGRGDSKPTGYKDAGGENR